MGTKKNNHTDPICFRCFEGDFIWYFQWTFLKIKNVGKIKNVKKMLKNVPWIKNVKKTFLHLCTRGHIRVMKNVFANRKCRTEKWQLQTNTDIQRHCVTDTRHLQAPAEDIFSLFHSPNWTALHQIFFCNVEWMNEWMKNVYLKNHNTNIKKI